MTQAMQQQPQNNVQVGATYCSSRGPQKERVCVLSVHSDRQGIPHVRYELSVQRCGSTPSVEQRTLALASFRARYNDRNRV
ncbi:MAG: hypothetical protein GC131_02040 [Alphaproteobacteria bacterium]|nr:hypothetical protein [Alphaproteobacteria bacterium]